MNDLKRKTFEGLFRDIESKEYNLKGKLSRKVSNIRAIWKYREEKEQFKEEK